MSSEITRPMGTKLTRNDHWMTDFRICGFDADRIFNMAVIEGHFFALDPMGNIILVALFGNGLKEYCNIKPGQRYRLIWACSLFSLTSILSFIVFFVCLSFFLQSRNCEFLLPQVNEITLCLVIACSCICNYLFTVLLSWFGQFTILTYVPHSHISLVLLRRSWSLHYELNL